MDSFAEIASNLEHISSGDGGKKRSMAHLLWIGSMIFEEWLQSKAKRVVPACSSIMRRNACCAPAVMLPVRKIKGAVKKRQKAPKTIKDGNLPVCLVQKHNFVPTSGQRHFFGGKHLDAEPNHIDAALVRGI